MGTAVMSFERIEALRQPNHWVQATPDCALPFIVARVSGAPDAERWA
jgi:hypothetical protein